MGENFAGIWQTDACPPTLKKMIFRTVIEEIIVCADAEKKTLQFTVHWKGGAHTRVEIERPRSVTECWVFSVQDNGLGFDSAYSDQIFGMFKRLHGSEIAGTGIGLAICKKVIESHGGKIWAASIRGVGSTFSFMLPDRRDL